MARYYERYCYTGGESDGVEDFSRDSSSCCLFASFPHYAGPTCPLCHNTAETIVHLFMQCSLVRPIWARIETVFNFSLPLSSNRLLYLNFDRNDAFCAATKTVVVTEVLHAIWLCRNRVYWDRETFDVNGIAAYCFNRLKGRIKADFGRLTPCAFAEVWGGAGTAVRVGPSGLSLNF